MRDCTIWAWFKMLIVTRRGAGGNQPPGCGAASCSAVPRFPGTDGVPCDPACGAGWLQARIAGVPITLGRKVISAAVAGSRLCLRLDDGTERLVDHALLATGFRVDVSRYPFLAPSLVKQLITVDGFPVLKRGLESSIRGLHFLGKPARHELDTSRFCFGAEFASTELVTSLTRSDGSNLAL